MPYAIKTLNLSKRFPLTKRYRELILNPFSHPEITALDDINILVNNGEVFGVLGPNGSGKTTLIKILSTLILPSAGKAFVNGLDVARQEKEIKRNIGYVVSDERSFFWRLTGLQNLRFFASLNNIPTSEMEGRIKDITALMGIEKEINMVFQNYSSGNKQKIAIARGLLTDPRILLLDEPTRNLDPASARKLRHFIKHTLVEESGKTVLIATNNMEETEDVCDRVAFIKDGRVIRSGTIEEVKRIGKVCYALSLLSTLEGIKSVTSNPLFTYRIVSISSVSEQNGNLVMTVEVNPEKEHISDVIEFLVGQGIRIESCEHQKQELHQLFTKSSDE